MTDDQKTIFAIRLRANSIWHQIYALARILFALLVILAAMAVVQVHLCRENDPDAKAMDCLRGKP